MSAWNKINLESEKVIGAYLEYKSVDKVAALLGCSTGPIYRILEENDIKKIGKDRTYSLKEDYFRYIDSPEKAYLLGFIASDGYNSGSRIVIAINKKDLEIIEFIKSEICEDIPIKIPRTDTIRIDIHSVRMCNDLFRHGIIKAKTKKLYFPHTVEDTLISHYLRGYFDGDGCISFNTHGRTNLNPRLGYCSASLCFIEKLEKVLRFNCNLKLKKLYKNSKSDTYSLEYEGRNQVEKIFNYLYKDSCFHLSRKFNKLNNYYNGIIHAATCV